MAQATIDTDNTPQRTVDAIERKAHEWLVRLTSGEATAADAERFRRWCNASSAHREAFARARRQWQHIGMAGSQLQGASRRLAAPEPRSRWNRRAVLGAMVAAPASLAVVAALHPPLGLWPPVSAMAADFHTGTGERLRIEPAPHLRIELDTQTSLRRRDDAAVNAFELLQGQAIVESASADLLALYVGAGCVTAEGLHTRLEVRHIDEQVRVTCLRGIVNIEHPQGRLQLQVGQQTRYDHRLSGMVSEAVATEVGAWTEGMLVFRRAPLSDVVDEINRYRRGRVILRDRALAREPVSGRFRVDDPDAALDQLRLMLSAQLRRYPGGIAVIG